jgi:PAS domain S-box-containing protein
MDTANKSTGHEDDNFTGALGVLEGAVDGFVACDSELRMIYLNTAAERLYGKSKPGLLGKTPWEASSDLAGSELEHEVRRVLAERMPGTLECYHRNTACWLEVRVAPVEGGGISLWLRDITKRKRADEALRKSEERFRLFMNNSPTVAWMKDEQGHCVYINEPYQKHFGVRLEDRLGKTDFEVYPLAIAEQFRKNDRAALVAGHSIEFTEESVNRDGKQCFWFSYKFPFQDSSGQVLVAGIGLDITERKQAEEALRQSETKLKEALRAAQMGAWEWTVETDTVTWDENLYRIADRDPKLPAPRYQEISQIFAPGSLEPHKAAVEKALAAGTPYVLDLEMVRPDGSKRWVVARGEPRHDASGRITHLRGTVQDITERKRAEERLAEYEKAVEGSEDMIVVVNREYRYLIANQEFLNQRRMERGEVVGHLASEVLGQEVFEQAVKSKLDECFQGRVVRYEMKHKYPTLGERDLSVTYFPIEGATGIDRAACVMRDITERKRAEKALSDSEYWLKESQRISQIGSYVLDTISGVLTTSETTDRIFGIGPDYPRTVDGLKAVIHPEQREEVMDYFTDEVLGQSKPFDREYRIIRPSDGQIRWVHGRGALVCDAAAKLTAMAGTIQDITVHKALEEKLRQAQKLEGLGRLAGGVAHDFNNLLTVINGYGTLLLRELKDGDPLRESVEEIHKAGEQAASLTRQLLMFSRKQLIEPRPLDLNQLISDNLGMLQRLVGEDIEVETRFAPSVGTVLADPGQMHQVLLNLAVNARDAMPRGGSLMLATSNADVKEGDSALHPGLAPGRYVLISVADNGTGIEAEAREHIFDPFFTTKGQGEGTGLGLATVYGIVQQAGGSISAHSEPGHGATFLIYLPRTKASVTARHKTAPGSFAHEGTETVLVVEDQDPVRKLTVRILKDHGYRVLDAAQGEEALLLAERYSKPIHLLLTDVVMPGMTGPELAKRLKPMRPAMQVLYMSGFAADVITSRGLLGPGQIHINKPFAPEDLVLKIRALLGSAPAPEAARVLVVDDESHVRTLFQKILAGGGYKVQIAKDGNQGLRMVRAQRFDLVVVDLVMPEREGIDIIQTVHKEQPDLKIIAVSGAFGGGFLNVAKLLGANMALAKPVESGKLLEAVRDVLGKTH